VIISVLPVLELLEVVYHALILLETLLLILNVNVKIPSIMMVQILNVNSVYSHV